MDQQMEVFNNEQFGSVRIIEEGDKYLFCGLDVAAALGYAKPRNAITVHCRCALKRGVPHPQAQNKEIEMIFIPEGDVYRLITHSKLPSAERFERWVFDEVLPTLRQTGSYVLQRPDSYMIDDPIERAKRWIEEAQERLALQAKVEADAPKVLFADAVATSKDSCLVGQLAKVLRQNGCNIGQNRLFDYLRNEGYLCKSGENRNMPTQRSIDAGWFEVKEGTLYNLDGTVRITRTPKVTNKGQIYFVNKFLKEDKHEVSSR
jgi:anti-repressor protein